MVKYELWLDGEPMDLAPDTAIDLTLRSNLFGDITSIESNYSQTINLPRTAHNARVLKTITPAGECTIGTAMTARLYQDGVTITDNGVAFLLKVSDTYEVCIIWGSFADVTQWLKRKDTLQDLDITEAVTLGGSKPSTAAAQTFMLYNADYATDGPITHPVVNVALLFYTLAQRGFGIAPPQEAFDNLRKVALPLATRNDSNKHNQALMQSFGTTEIVSGSEWNIVPTFSRLGNADYTRQLVTGVITYMRAKTVNRIYINLPKLNLLKTIGNQSAAQLILEVNADGERNRYPLTYGNIVGQVYYYEYEGEVKLQKAVSADSMTMALVIASTMPDGARWDVEESDPGTLVALHTELPEGYEYDMAANLPAKMTQMDFVKACMQMAGLGLTQSSNGLEMVDYNAILEGSYGFVDWTDRLVNVHTLKQSHMTAGVAQSLLLGYKNDKVTINIPDASLDVEGTLFELPFNYTDSRNMHFYERKSDGTYTLLKNDNNALLRLSETATVATLQPSTELAAAALLRGGWAGYAELLQDPIVIECEVRLTAADIQTLDFTKLVHLGQLGRNYAVLEVRLGSNDIAQVKFIQIGA